MIESKKIILLVILLLVGILLEIKVHEQEKILKQLKAERALGEL